MKSYEALAQLAEGLTAGGVPTAVDPRDVNLPGGWLQRVWIDEDLLGCATLRVRLYLISPDVGTPSALGHLDDMYELACVVLPPNAGTPCTDTGVVLPANKQVMPAVFYDALVQLVDDPTP